MFLSSSLRVQLTVFMDGAKEYTFKYLSSVSDYKLFKDKCNGEVRYCIGDFKEFNLVERLLNQMIGLGYYDSFVVGYRDRKLITALIVDDFLLKD